MAVKHPVSRSKRTDYIELTGQKLYPAIQLEDGTVVRRESKELVELIKPGQLMKSASAESPAEPAA